MKTVSTFCVCSLTAIIVMFPMFSRWYTSTLCCLMWVQMCIFPFIFQFNIFCLISAPSTTMRLIYHVWIINCYCCHLFHFILFLLLSIQMIAQFYCHFFFVCVCVYNCFFVCTVSLKWMLLVKRCWWASERARLCVCACIST